LTYVHNTDDIPEAKAAREALEAFKAASLDRKRCQIMAFSHEEDFEWLRRQGTEVTEDVVTLMDLISGSMEWGSGFYDAEDLAAYTRLASLLKFDPIPDPPLNTNPNVSP
jgi:hypothetical protein